MIAIDKLNNKLIIFLTVLLIVNFVVAENILLGSALALIEIIILLAYAIITKSVKKVFLLHLIFLITSLEVTTDLGNYSGVVYGYKHFEVPGVPIAISTLITLFLFLINIISTKKVKIPRNDIIFNLLIFYLIVPFALGLVGLGFRSYEFDNFFTAMMQPLLYFCVYYLLLNFKESSDLSKLNDFIIAALVSSVLGSYLGAAIGVSASYGAHSTFPANQIIWFSPFLLIYSLYLEGKNRKIIFGCGILGAINLIAFNATGKTILFVILAMILYIYKNITNIRRSLKFTILAISMGTIVVIISLFYRDLLNPSVLLSAKFDQLTALLNIKNWGNQFNMIPFSPRVRLIETINIFLTLKDNVVDLFLGRGFGGYFTDESGLFSNLNLYNGAFSDHEIISGRFIAPHESWNEILLSSGLLGIILWMKVVKDFLINVLKDNIISFYSILALIFVGLMWNSYILLLYFGLVSVYISKKPRGINSTYIGD